MKWINGSHILSTTIKYSDDIQEIFIF